MAAIFGTPRSHTLGALGSSNVKVELKVYTKAQDRSLGWLAAHLLHASPIKRLKERRLVSFSSAMTAFFFVFFFFGT